MSIWLQNYKISSHNDKKEDRSRTNIVYFCIKCFKNIRHRAYIIQEHSYSTLDIFLIVSRLLLKIVFQYLYHSLIFIRSNNPYLTEIIRQFGNKSYNNSLITLFLKCLKAFLCLHKPCYRCDIQENVLLNNFMVHFYESLRHFIYYCLCSSNFEQ